MDCLREKNHCDTGQAILGKKHWNEYKSEKMVLGEEVIRATMPLQNKGIFLMSI